MPDRIKKVNKEDYNGIDAASCTYSGLCGDYRVFRRDLGVRQLFRQVCEDYFGFLFRREKIFLVADMCEYRSDGRGIAQFY